jgi:hypothetical protein
MAIFAGFITILHRVLPFYSVPQNPLFTFFMVLLINLLGFFVYWISTSLIKIKEKKKGTPEAPKKVEVNTQPQEDLMKSSFIASPITDETKKIPNEPPKPMKKDDNDDAEWMFMVYSSILFFVIMLFCILHVNLILAIYGMQVSLWKYMILITIAFIHAVVTSLLVQTVFMEEFMKKFKFWGFNFMVRIGIHTFCSAFTTFAFYMLSISVWFFH